MPRHPRISETTSHPTTGVITCPRPDVVPRLLEGVISRLCPGVIWHMRPDVVPRLLSGVISRLCSDVIAWLRSGVIPRLLAGVIPLLAAATTTASAQDGAHEILSTVDSLQALVVFETVTVEMRLFEGDREVRRREMEVKRENRNGEARSLVVFTDPADIRGTSLLTVEEGGKTDQRLYLPSLRRIQHITSDRREDRFVGSDFSFEDLRSRDPDDYRSLILASDDSTWTLGMTPQDDGSPYGRLEVEVDKRRLAVGEARYFDRDGELKKVLVSSDFVEVASGVWQPAIMTMTDIQDNRRTELSYRDRDVESEIPSSTFTERQLRRGS